MVSTDEVGGAFDDGGLGEGDLGGQLSPRSLQKRGRSDRSECF